MVEPYPPVLPPGVADRYVELFLFAPLLSLGALYGLFWLVRTLHFYSSNGWDFSRDFGPEMVDEATDRPVGPVGKMVCYLFFIAFFGGFAALIFFKP